MGFVSDIFGGGDSGGGASSSTTTSTTTVNPTTNVGVTNNIDLRPVADVVTALTKSQADAVAAVQAADAAKIGAMQKTFTDTMTSVQTHMDSSDRMNLILTLASVGLMVFHPKLR